MVVICILTAEKSMWPDATPYAVSSVLIYAGALNIQKVQTALCRSPDTW